MNTTVIPETELEAQDPDKDDVLFYTLQEVTPVSVPDPHANSEPSRRAAPLHVPQGLRLSRTRPPPPPQGAGSFFSLLGTNLPALRLDRPLDFYKWQNMSLLLLVRVSRPGHPPAAPSPRSQA